MMARWTVDVSDDVDRVVRDFLNSQDEEHRDLAKFIEQAVAWRVFEETVEKIKDRNAKYDQDEILHTIDEAVRETRANRP